MSRIISDFNSDDFIWEKKRIFPGKPLIWVGDYKLEMDAGILSGNKYVLSTETLNIMEFFYNSSWNLSFNRQKTIAINFAK
jgi:hypothetical protein